MKIHLHRLIWASVPDALGSNAMSMVQVNALATNAMRPSEKSRVINEIECSALSG